MEQKSAMSRNQQQHCRHQGFRPVQSARRREQDVVWRERNGSAAAQEHKSSGPGYRAEAKDIDSGENNPVIRPEMPAS